MHEKTSMNITTHQDSSLARQSHHFICISVNNLVSKWTTLKLVGTLRVWIYKHWRNHLPSLSGKLNTWTTFGVWMLRSMTTSWIPWCSINLPHSSLLCSFALFLLLDVMTASQTKLLYPQNSIRPMWMMGSRVITAQNLLDAAYIYVRPTFRILFALLGLLQARSQQTTPGHMRACMPILKRTADLVSTYCQITQRIGHAFSATASHVGRMNIRSNNQS